MISGNKWGFAALYLFTTKTTMMRQRHFGIIALTLFALLAGCAKQGMPGGGPKDVAPPVQQRVTPESRTLGFEGNQFYIEFDEYVVLKDAENNVLVSPPMKQKPEYKTKGRGIQVRIKDTLQPNTTYVFQFKEAIADFNEGNLLPSLEYVFSTGSYIDSMTIGGRATDALTGEPREEAASVWLLSAGQREALLRSLADTAVLTPTPTYATRCDKQGNFSFNYIRPGEYYILAVADEDKNMTIGPGEAVGFLDAPVPSRPMADSSAADTTQPRQQATPQAQIKIFEPKNDKQRVTGSNFTAEGKVVITTMLPMLAPTLESGGEKTTFRLNATRDTLTLWTLRKECDSLQLTLHDATGLQDTLRLRWRPKKGLGAKGLKSDQKLNYSKLPYYDTLALMLPTPLASWQRADSAVRIIRLKDSSIAYCPLVPDSARMRATVDYAFQQGEKYGVAILKGHLRTIYNQDNDSLSSSIEVTKAEDYGNLRLTLGGDPAAGEGGGLIVQLLDEKGKVLDSRQAAAGDRLEFLNLKPAKYRLRAIADSNGNGKWDPGDLQALRQPEAVTYYPKTLDVRANWDFDETFKIGK